MKQEIINFMLQSLMTFNIVVFSYWVITSIIKWLEEVITPEHKAWVKLGKPLYQEDYDPNVDSYFKQALEVGIKSIKPLGLHTIATLSNGITLTFWDSNKYYSWCARGTVTYENKVISSWEEGRPSSVTMLAWKEALAPFEEEIKRKADESLNKPIDFKEVIRGEV